MKGSDTFAIVGLTGGIASGKSTVARRLGEHGVPVIDADQIARRVVQPGAPALDDIVEAFGQHILREDGSLNRPALGELVFRDKRARATLDAITHPRIAQQMAAQAQALRAQGHAWIVYDAALIVENGMHAWLDALIVVAVTRQTQLARLVERDQLTPEEAARRVDAQLPLADKVAVADYVIDNNGSLADTFAQVDVTFQGIDHALNTWGRPTAAPKTS